MAKSFFVLLFSIILVGSALAQQSTQSIRKQLRSEEMRSSARVAQLSSALTAGQEGFDVTYYKLDLKLVVTPTNRLSGAVTMIAKSIVSNLNFITLDLMNSMSVDSVYAGGKRVTLSQQPTFVSINLDRAYANGEMFTVVVYYQGVPVSSGFGSFNFSTVPGSGTPWVWSLSEPYGAKDWWPCKDHPGDKADSVDVWVTCDSQFKVGSEGKLVAVVDNGNGTKTHKWQHRYPIATYLVSITVSVFSEVSGWFKYNQSDSMQVLDYALPTNVPPETPNIVSATASMGNTLAILQIYSDLFGLYPFIKEKYGFSQFGWGGGMEHQTMTSVVNFDESLLAHETAHQWFGDMITMSSWPHIWLNEGFATYCVALYRERRYGTADYWDEINNYISPGVKGTPGSVYVRDTSNVGSVFSAVLVYHRGGMALHMLRHVLGDSVFFRAMRQYAQDPRFRFKTASTEDFQSVCEAVSGNSLGYFFNEWIYGEKYPVYHYEWGSQSNGSSYTARVTLSQTTGTSTPTFFQMPIDFEFKGPGFDTTFVRMNDTQNQTFTFTLPAQPGQFLLDPNGWIVKDLSGTVVSIEKVSGAPREFALLQNYPNPFNPSTLIPFELPSDSKVRLEVYNELGELVQVPLSDQTLTAGSYTVQFLPVSLDGKALSSGVYFYRLVVSGIPIQTRKMILMR